MALHTRTGVLPAIRKAKTPPEANRELKDWADKVAKLMEARRAGQKMREGGRPFFPKPGGSSCDCATRKRTHRFAFAKPTSCRAIGALRKAGSNRPVRGGVQLPSPARNRPADAAPGGRLCRPERRHRHRLVWWFRPVGRPALRSRMAAPCAWSTWTANTVAPATTTPAPCPTASFAKPWPK